MDFIILIIFFSQNTGLGERAIKKVNNQIKPFLKSKYIFRIDSDDYLIDKTKFEKQISYLEHNPICRYLSSLQNT